MEKFLQRYSLLSVMLFGLGSQTAEAAYDGTPVTPAIITAENYADFGLTEDEAAAYANYYAITSAEELYGFAALVNDGQSSANGILINDITVNEHVLNEDGTLKAGNANKVWSPIGTSSDVRYLGKFDGRHHTVSGLYVGDESITHIGLFGYVQPLYSNLRPQIYNVSVTDTYFVGKSPLAIGAIVGSALYTDIQGCYAEATLGAAGLARGVIGGILGNAQQVVIDHCGSNCRIAGYQYLGGIVGRSEGYLTLSNCYSVSTISGRTNYCASICGSTSATATNCYYLENSACDGKSVYQNGLGYGTQGITNEDDPLKTMALKESDFVSGRVAWELNDRKSSGSLVWGQRIGVDKAPMLIGYPDMSIEQTTVYAAQPCHSTFANSQKALEHKLENGFCSECDGLSAPALSADGYYEIGNGGQLYWFAEQVNGGSCFLYRNKWWYKTNSSVKANPTLNVRLTADITVNEGVLDKGVVTTDAQKLQSFRWWEPIGRNEDVTWYGKFDGQYHRISGLYTDYLNTTNCSGLFGCIMSPSSDTRIEIKNLILEDSYLSGKNYVGGICGKTRYVDIQECMNFAHVRAINEYVGGIAGWFEKSSITNSGNVGHVSGKQYVAGVVGDFVNTNLYCTNCYNVGKVQGNGWRVSAIVSGYSGSNYGSNNFYLENSAHDGSTYQNGYGASSKGSTASDNPDIYRAMQREDFVSGRVSWLLNKRSLEDVAWYQEIGVDTIPVLSKGGGQRSKVVYASLPCESTFYNEQKTLAHRYDDGFCTGCDDYEKPTLAEDGYYEIDNSGKLYWFAKSVNGYCRYNYRNSWWKRFEGEPDRSINGRLTADIKVNEGVLVNGLVTTDTDLRKTFRWWEPIGSDEDVAWYGNFDGNYHSISGLYTNFTSSTSYAALFGYIKPVNVTDRVEIKNLTIKDSFFGASSTVAGICAQAYRTDLISCYNYAHVQSAHNYAGGLVAWFEKGTVANSGNAGYVEGGAYVAGLIGDNANSDLNITNSYNYGIVQGSGYRVAAICSGYSGTNNARNNYYLEKCAHDGSVYQNGYGASQKGAATTSENPNYYKALSRESFLSGEVTWKLNRGETDGLLMWCQRIGVDTIPVAAKGFEGSGGSSGSSGCNVPAGAIVYATQPCHSGYSNKPGAMEHRYENGFCAACDDFEPAVLAEDGSYEIGNGGQLYWFADKANGGHMVKNGASTWYWTSGEPAQPTINGRLTADIFINEAVIEDGTLTTDAELRKSFRWWAPIGYYSNNGSIAYQGNFDGQHHTISGLYHNSTSSSNVGVFGRVEGISKTDRKEIRNLRVEDSYFASTGDLGGIVGYAKYYVLSYLQNGATLYNTGNETGGIVGESYFSRMVSCGNTGSLTGKYRVGGIVGQAGNSDSIMNCYSIGAVEATGYAAGSIMGNNYPSLCANCYYLEGSAHDPKVTQYGAGYGEAGKVLTDRVGRTIPMTRDKFESGEACYRLNGYWQSLGTESAEWKPGKINIDTQISNNGWYQVLGTDLSPIPNPAHKGVTPLPVGDDSFWFYNVGETLVLGDKADYLINLDEEISISQIEYRREVANSGNIWGTLCLPFEVETDGSIQYFEYSKGSVADGRLYFKRVNKASAGTPLLFRRLDREGELVIKTNNVTLGRANALDDAGVSCGQMVMKGTYTSIESLGGEEAADEANPVERKLAYYYIGGGAIKYAKYAFKVPAYRCWFETEVTAGDDPSMGAAFKRNFQIVEMEDVESALDECICEHPDGTIELSLDLLGRVIEQKKAGQIYIENNTKKLFK